MTDMRAELPELPRKMRGLKIDDRGYPVPWFVPWLDESEREVQPGEGKPEFRVMSERRLVQAIKESRCWLCGERLGKYRAFVIGPMCLVNRINAEPPSHLECADYAARACPFLTRPHARRRDNSLPGEAKEAAGMMIERNPGIAVVYVVSEPAPLMRANGVLFMLPEPVEVRFYAEGRAAAPVEIAESIGTGLPTLLGVCQNDEERDEVFTRARKVYETYLDSESADLWAQTAEKLSQVAGTDVLSVASDAIISA
jgi:hypothetical protein